MKDYVEVTVRLPKPKPGKEWYYVADAMAFGERCERKVLDWSKVGPDVLVATHTGDIQPMRYPTLERFDRIYEGWQAHLGGECPVDPEACMVEVIYPSHPSSNMAVGGTAKYWDWSEMCVYRVTGLAEGYEYL